MTTALATRPRRVGFFGAAAAPWRGLGFVVATPSAWPLAAVPVVVALTLIALLSGLSIVGLPKLVASLIGPTSSWYGNLGVDVLDVIAVVAGIVVAILVAVVLAQPLSGAALAELVRLRERTLGVVARPPTSFWTEVGRSARGAAIGAIGIVLVLSLTILELAIPGSTVVILPLKVLVSGVFVSWDLLDYPLSARDFRVRDRLAWMARHKLEVLGFGVSLAVVFLLPCAQLLLLPAGVVGATELARRVDEAEQ